MVYMVGGGIASMAAAVFMIRDGDVFGHTITILEESDRIGGSLDGAGSAARGYVVRGGRMLESKYLCTLELFASIPTLDDRETVTQEIFRWDEMVKTSSKSRLVRDGSRQTAPRFGLSERHILTIERLVLEPESLLGKTRIADQFDPAFFKTDFWFMWCTTFAFQPWHSAVELKRYLARFVHMIEGFSRLNGIMRTAYNQYDSMVRPLRKWLDERGVKFEMNTRVTNLGFTKHDGKDCVERIVYERGGAGGEIKVAPGDYVLVTLGSMTEASSLGTMDAPPGRAPSETVVPGRCGKQWRQTMRLSDAPQFFLTMSNNRSGFLSPPLCTSRHFLLLSNTSPATSRAKAAWSRSRIQAGSSRLLSPISRISSDSQKMSVCSGATGYRWTETVTS
jgi:oleate hydratase